jgi:hypothetical protein
VSYAFAWLKPSNSFAYTTSAASSTDSAYDTRACAHEAASRPTARWCSGESSDRALVFG